MADKYSMLAKFGADTTGLKQGFNRAKRDSDQFANHLKKLGGLMAGAFSVGAVLNFGRQAVQAYNEASLAGAKLSTALRGNEGAFRRLSTLASELQGKTLFDDDSTKSAMGMLAQLGMTERQIRMLIPLIQDFAQAQGLDLDSAAKLVAKSVGSSTNALARYGVQIEGTAGSMERAQSMADALNKMVGGQAEAAAGVGAASITQLTNAWGDFMEQVGRSMDDGGRLADVGKFLTWVVEGFTEAIKTSGEKTQDYVNQQADWLISTHTQKMDGMIAELMKAGKSATEAQKEVMSKFVGVFGDKNIERLKKVEEIKAEIARLQAGMNTGSDITYQQDRENMLSAKKIADLNKELEGITQQSEIWRKVISSVSHEYNAILDNEKKIAAERAKASAELAARNKGTSKIAGLQAVGFSGTIAQDKLTAGKATGYGSDKGLKLGQYSENFMNFVSNEYDAAADRVMQINDLLVQSTRAFTTEIAAGFGEAIGGLVSGSMQMGDVLKGLLGMFLDFMQQIGKGMIATAAASIAFQSNLFGNPFAAVAAGVALIALSSALKGLMQKGPEAPALAQGGLAYGPTAAIVGDNPRANVDPEVIAPLSKLQNIIGGSQSGQVEFIISGDKLKGVLNRYDRRLNTIT